MYTYFLKIFRCTLTPSFTIFFLPRFTLALVCRRTHALAYRTCPGSMKPLYVQLPISFLVIGIRSASLDCNKQRERERKRAGRCTRERERSVKKQHGKELLSIGGASVRSVDMILHYDAFRPARWSSMRRGTFPRRCG